MKNLKHEILSLLFQKGGEEIKQTVVHANLHGELADIDAAFEELDMDGNAIYKRTLEGVSLVANSKTKQAFEDGIYLEKEVLPADVVKIAEPVKSGPARVGGKFVKKA